MLDLEIHHDLTPTALRQVRGLLEETTALEGHTPIGEHKMAHLEPHASDWDGIFAYDEHGELVAYAHLRWNPSGTDPRLAVEMVVHPAHRDVGVQPALLDAARRLVSRSGGGRMFLWVHRVEDPEATLARQMGFEVQRVLAHMRRPASRPIADPVLPEDVHIRTYRGHADDAAFLRINNAAFAGHPENGDWTVEDFRERQRLDWFDPDGLFMAFRGDEPLGLHWTKWHHHEPHDGRPAPHPPLGEVYVLAVHPDAQGLGLGRALLRHGMRHLASRSEELVLYVDRADEAAVRLYTDEGFALVYADVCYVDVIAPARTWSREVHRPG